MKRRTVSISQAKAGLSELVHGVAFAGEEVVIAWHGKPRAVLKPIHAPGRDEADARSASMLEGLRLADKFRLDIARRTPRSGRRPLPAWKEIREMRNRRMAQLDP